MYWPPNKAWTSTSLRKGYRHFVAINYGGEKSDRWVSLVSVLDGKARFRVSLAELKDPQKWVSGWQAMPREESNPTPAIDETSSAWKAENQSNCLHPSNDSGLIIPSSVNPRPWFVEKQ